ncbi:hypothetical protein SAMN06298216_1816 [Spirosomataceae bacterium TFI 002]|nr:hypothetical protein SAMN06298216_1816 [Spirosomataceae bacterium TFI 002]
MKYLIILSLLSLFACEKEKLPTTPTVINGSIVDENDVPIPGFKVLFYSIVPKGFQPKIITFRLETTSDENGAFSFSQVIPNETQEIKLKAMGVGLSPIPNGFDYAYFINDR